MKSNYSPRVLHRRCIGILLVWFQFVYCSAAREPTRENQRQGEDINGAERRLKGGKSGKGGFGKDSLVGGPTMGDFQSNNQDFSVSPGDCRCEYPQEGLYQNGRQLRSRQTTNYVDVNGVTVFPTDYFACRGVVYVCQGDFFSGPLWNYDCSSSGSGSPYRGAVVIVPSDHPLCACPAVSTGGSSNGRYRNPLVGTNGYYHYSHKGNGLNFNVYNLQPGKKGKRGRRRTASVASEGSGTIMKNPRFELIFETRIGKGKSKAKGSPKKAKSKAKGAKGKSKKGGNFPTYAPFRCPPTVTPVAPTFPPTLRQPRTPAPSSEVTTFTPTITEFPTLMPAVNMTTMPSSTPTSFVLSGSPSASDAPTRPPKSQAPSTAPTPSGTTTQPSASAIPTTAFTPTVAPGSTVTLTPTVTPAPSSFVPSSAVPSTPTIATTPVPTPTTTTGVPSDVPSITPSIVPSVIAGDQQATVLPTAQIEAFPTPSPTARVVGATLSPTVTQSIPTLHSQIPSLLPYCREPAIRDSEDEEPTLQPSSNPHPTPVEVVGVTCRLRPPTTAPSYYPTLDSSDMNEVIACIAIIDDAENVTAESLNATWSAFRSKYPSRSFCLLQPLPNEKSELKIPESFYVDPKTIYSRITRDYAAGALASSWFRLCSLETLRSQGVNKVAVFIDEWSRITARQVRASYEFFLLDITAQGISLVRVHEGVDDNWVSPFVKDFH